MSTGRMARLAAGSVVFLAAATVVAGCGAGSDRIAGAPGSAPAASTATAITLPEGFPVGTWTTTITADDLAAITTRRWQISAYVTTLDRQFTLVLGADGTWSALRTDVPSSGRLQGHPVWADAFDLTTFPPDYAGDVVRIEWRTADDKLLLTVPDPPDPILPVTMGAHPWSPAG